MKLTTYIFLMAFNAGQIKYSRSLHTASCIGNGLKTPFNTYRGCECANQYKLCNDKLSKCANE